MKLPQIQQIMQEFEKQSEIMDMKEEMMNDVIDDAMGDEDDEEERWVQCMYSGRVLGGRNRGIRNIKEEAMAYEVNQQYP